jgi:hypothetical protein
MEGEVDLQERHLAPSALVRSILRQDSVTSVLQRCSTCCAASALARELGGLAALAHLPPAAYGARVVDALRGELSLHCGCGHSALEELYGFLGALKPEGGVRFFCGSASWAVRSSSSFSDVSQRLWPALHALVDSAARYDFLFRGRAALELGSGTGIAGLVLSDILPLRSLELTDGDPVAVAQLLESAKSRARRPRVSPRGRPGREGELAAELAASGLRWGELAESADLVDAVRSRATAFIASDVTYDLSIASTLATALRLLLQTRTPSSPSPVAVCETAGLVSLLCADPTARFMLLASTVRDSDTQAVFADRFAENGLRSFELRDCEAGDGVLDSGPMLNKATVSLVVHESLLGQAVLDSGPMLDKASLVVHESLVGKATA